MALTIRGRLPCPTRIEVIPIEDGVESHRERALRLPAPEGTDGEHHDVTLANGFIDQLRAVDESLATFERAGEQHVRRVRRELNDDSRPRGGISGKTRDWLRDEGAAETAAARAATAPTAGRAVAGRGEHAVSLARMIRIPRRELELRRHWRR